MRLREILGLAAITTTLVLVSPDSQAEDTSPDPYSHVYIVSPLQNEAFPDVPTTLDVQATVYQGFEDSIANVELFVDNVSFAVQECAAGCTFVGVELDQGVHTLRVVADSGSVDIKMVYVAEEPPSDTSEGGETEGDATGNGDEANEGGNDDSSGGCEIADPSPPWGLLALPALLLLVAGRRR